MKRKSRGASPGSSSVSFQANVSTHTVAQVPGVVVVETIPERRPRRTPLVPYNMAAIAAALKDAPEQSGVPMVSTHPNGETRARAALHGLGIVHRGSRGRVRGWWVLIERKPDIR
jgi:hypothetical protein